MTNRPFPPRIIAENRKGRRCNAQIFCGRYPGRHGVCRRGGRPAHGPLPADASRGDGDPVRRGRPGLPGGDFLLSGGGGLGAGGGGRPQPGGTRHPGDRVPVPAQGGQIGHGDPKGGGAGCGGDLAGGERPLRGQVGPKGGGEKAASAAENRPGGRHAKRPGHHSPGGGSAPSGAGPASRRPEGGDPLLLRAGAGEPAKGPGCRRKTAVSLCGARRGLCPRRGGAGPFPGGQGALLRPPDPPHW